MLEAQHNVGPWAAGSGREQGKMRERHGQEKAVFEKESRMWPLRAERGRQAEATAVSACRRFASRASEVAWPGVETGLSILNPARFLSGPGVAHARHRPCGLTQAGRHRHAQAK